MTKKDPVITYDHLEEEYSTLQSLSGPGYGRSGGMLSFLLEETIILGIFAVMLMML